MMQTIYKNNYKQQEDVIILDLDWCVITPRCIQNKRPSSPYDWMLSQSNVIDVLKGHICNDFSVIFFNEYRPYIEENIDRFADLYDIPFLAIIVHEREYMKPSALALMPYALSERSVFVSNAIDEALNMEFCKRLGVRMTYCYRLFPVYDIKRETQEIVVLVGYPGSGKTTYAMNNYSNREGYAILHGDELRGRLLRRLCEELDMGRSVVVDATNPSRPCRQRYIKIGMERGLEVRCIHINTDNCISNRRNRHRPNRVPNSAFRSYTNRFDKPSLEEGFKNILII